MLGYKMNKNVMLFVAFLLGFLVSNMMKSTCNKMEGQTCGSKIEGYGGSGGGGVKNKNYKKLN